MRQTTLCVPLEVKPESADRLNTLIDVLKHSQDLAGDPDRPNFAALLTAIPTLHFMSMSVFPGHDVDPMFIIEVNFDGPEGSFWKQTETFLGSALRPMLRCCKRPFDGSGSLYDAATTNMNEPVVPYLEAHVQRPSVFFHGNRGLGRDRILDEHALFIAARNEIDNPDRSGPNPYRAGGATGLHQQLRAAMLPRFPALAAAAQARISTSERAIDLLRLMRFIVLTLLVLSLPGLLLAPLVPTPLYLVITAIMAAASLGLLWRYRHAVTGTAVGNRVNPRLPGPKTLLSLAAGLVMYVVAAMVVLSPLVFTVQAISIAADAFDIGHSFNLWSVVRETARAVALALVSLVATLPLLVLLLRYNEMRDSAQDAPLLNNAVLREIERREDWIMQNHMGSIVSIKPGILRSTIIRAGHYGLGLFLRVTASDGYLGSMRTVHFAHWAFLNNNSRLLFFSNFDHSWGSYLDDFIEKSHAGLTLAWGSGVGFPRTRLLVLDGASHGRQFKTWALASRTVSRFWYSAYRDLTVDQIERNFRLATGLRQVTMTEKEAIQWAWDL